VVATNVVLALLLFHNAAAATAPGKASAETTTTKTTPLLSSLPFLTATHYAMQLFGYNFLYLANLFLVYSSIL